MGKHIKKVIDLTHTINEDSPIWPTEDPKEKYSTKILNVYRTHGFYSRSINIPEHYGTHVDAPCHSPAGKLPINRIAVKKLVSPAVVIDVRKKVKNNANYLLTIDEIRRWETVNGKIPNNSVVFMLTGWGKFWKNKKRFLNQDNEGTMNFPGFSAESVNFLIQKRNINGIGTETSSIDAGNSKDFSVHHILFKSNKYAIENLTNLHSLPPSGAILIVAPLKIEDGSGSPARVFAII